MLHFNGHFYIFGLLAQFFFRIYGIYTTAQDAILFWYTILHFNCNTKHNERLSDSTKSRDQHMNLDTDQQIVPESQLSATEII